MEQDNMMALWNPFQSVLQLFDLRRLRDRTKEKNLLSDFQRIELTGTDTNKVHIYDIKQTSKQLVEALNLRQKYMSLSCQRFPDTTSKFLQKDLTPKDLTESQFFEMKNGVVFLYENEEKKRENQPLKSPYPDIDSFIIDHTTMFKLLNDGPLRSFCSTRLCFLSTKFNMHILVNSLKEAAAQKILSQIDFNRVIKIDTHVHASGCIHPTDLLQFIKKKLRDGKAVYKNKEDDKEQTLKKVLDEYDLKDGSLNEDTMDVNADPHTFRRFDIFNAKYNPFGQSKLREIFFKTDNHIKGQYFAEILNVMM